MGASDCGLRSVHKPLIPSGVEHHPVAVIVIDHGLVHKPLIPSGVEHRAMSVQLRATTHGAQASDTVRC